MYTLDRETGEFLWAKPTIAQNLIDDIDGETGAVSENPELIFTDMGQEVVICPTLSGGKDWEAGAYSPATHLMYMPLRNTCARIMTIESDNSRLARELYSLTYRNQIAPGTDQVGSIHAISVETGETAWKYEQRAATTSLMTTGGGLVFGGDSNGRFRALDDRSGDVLWEINLGSPISGFPITYAVDGTQYVVASTGMGGNPAVFLALTPEMRPSAGNTLFVFALPE